MACSCTPKSTTPLRRTEGPASVNSAELQLYPKVYHTASGLPYTVTALVLPPKTILGLFLPVRDRPDAPYRLGWWSPYERGQAETGEGCAADN